MWFLSFFQSGSKDIQAISSNTGREGDRRGDGNGTWKAFHFLFSQLGIWTTENKQKMYTAAHVSDWDDSSMRELPWGNISHVFCSRCEHKLFTPGFYYTTSGHMENTGWPQAAHTHSHIHTYQLRTSEWRGHLQDLCNSSEEWRTWRASGNYVTVFIDSYILEDGNLQQGWATRQELVSEMEKWGFIWR